jgi:hypothetical protein
MSSFIAEKLDNPCLRLHPLSMPKGTQTSGSGRHAARIVRRRIEAGGERLWRLRDFCDLPVSAVPQALSRLTRQGEIERLSKGIYYRARNTAFGKSHPNPAQVRQLAAKDGTVFPSGIAAANLLGFTTQNPGRNEVATSSLSLPRKLIGTDTIIHGRRPEAWIGLSDADAALLDFLRRAGKTSELSPDETARRVLALFSEKDRLARLFKVAGTEPPRVRAMLGAIGEQLSPKSPALRRLRSSLNPLSRFDFGMLSTLPNARDWQGRGSAE